MPASVDLTNGQKVEASFDLYDIKNKPITSLPSGATIVFSNDNEGVAQFAPPPGTFKGEVTTLTDDVGVAHITGTLTLSDGTIKSDTLTVNVTNSAPGEARFTVGVPTEE